MYRLNKLSSFAVLAMAASFVACKSNQPTVDGDKLVVTDGSGAQHVVVEWWNNPGDIGKFAAAGAAKIHGNIGTARNRAEVQARATLAASLKAEVQSLAELWSQEAGDNMNEDSISSMFNDETFIRQIVDTTLIGARVDRFKPVDGYMYALVILEKPETFLGNIVDKAEEDLKSDAYYETEVKKGVARDRLDELVGNKMKEIESESAKMQANLATLP
jgi:hypothetical protein